MLEKTIVLTMTCAIAACSKSPPPNPSQGVPTMSASAPAAAVIDLQPLTISFRGSTIARLMPDGRTESAGPNAPGTTLVPGPTLHADGTIAMTKGGVTARIDGKGDVYVIDGARREQLFGRISGDQLTVVGSTKAWDARVQGNVIEFGEENSSQIDGDVTPSMRRTALIMTAAFYIEGALTKTEPK